jgi:hypothetical protein
VTRDAHNDVMMMDPSGQGRALVDIVRTQSPGTPLKIEGQEVVLLDHTAAPTQEREQ